MSARSSRHHAHSPKVGHHTRTHCSTTSTLHPAMAPRPLTHLPPTTCALQWQWHPTMAPRPHSPKVGRRPPHRSTNGARSTPVPQSALQWHHVHCTLQWHRCHEVVCRPAHLLEVRNPIATAIWGKHKQTKKQNTTSKNKETKTNEEK